MKRPLLPLLAAVLSLAIAAMFAISYMNTRQPAQVIIAAACMIVGATMFIRYKRVNSPAPPPS